MFEQITEILGTPDLEGETLCIWKKESYEFGVVRKLDGEFLVTFTTDGSGATKLEISSFDDVINVSKLFEGKADPNPEQETTQATETQYDHEPDEPMVIKEGVNTQDSFKESILWAFSQGIFLISI